RAKYDALRKLASRDDYRFHNGQYPNQNVCTLLLQVADFYSACALVPAMQGDIAEAIRFFQLALDLKQYDAEFSFYDNRRFGISSSILRASEFTSDTQELRDLLRITQNSARKYKDYSEYAFVAAGEHRLAQLMVQEGFLDAMPATRG